MLDENGEEKRYGGTIDLIQEGEGRFNFSFE